MVSVIKVERTTTTPMPEGENDDYKTFQIAEIKAYDINGRQLVASDYSSAIVNAIHTYWYPENVIDGDIYTSMHTAGNGDHHWLQLNLKTSTPISKVEVLSRQDCCWSRLEGAVLKLIDASGTTLRAFGLQPVNTVQILKI